MFSLLSWPRQCLSLRSSGVGSSCSHSGKTTTGQSRPSRTGTVTSTSAVSSATKLSRPGSAFGEDRETLIISPHFLVVLPSKAGSVSPFRPHFSPSGIFRDVHGLTAQVFHRPFIGLSPAVHCPFAAVSPSLPPPFTAVLLARPTTEPNGRVSPGSTRTGSSGR